MKSFNFDMLSHHNYSSMVGGYRQLVVNSVDTSASKPVLLLDTVEENINFNLRDMNPPSTSLNFDDPVGLNFTYQPRDDVTLDLIIDDMLPVSVDQEHSNITDSVSSQQPSRQINMPVSQLEWSALLPNKIRYRNHISIAPKTQPATQNSTFHLAAYSTTLPLTTNSHPPGVTTSNDDRLPSKKRKKLIDGVPDHYVSCFSSNLPSTAETVRERRAQRACLRCREQRIKVTTLRCTQKPLTNVGSSVLVGFHVRVAS
jgi:hypothetical protein